MKKFLIAAGVVVALGLYIVFARGSKSADIAPSVAVQTPSASPDTTATPPIDQPSGTPPPQNPAPVASGLYKDGSYTGNAADAFYGTLQVQAVIQGGKLADVKFLKYPNDPGHTTEVSNSSLPKLKSEAIQVQSAKVDIVSGATQTSEAFQQSLANALSQAKA